MVKLTDILSYEDHALLLRDIEEGYIRARTHPLYPELLILNYSEKTQFEKHWNVGTRMCRGLIINQWTDEIIARPFHKIHNFDEQEAPKIEWDQVLYHAGDKLDGSLGIVYQNPDGLLEVATRGSFESEQAKFATEWLRYHAPEVHEEALLHIGNGYTPLFEIIYPENRIVLDYGDFAGMMPLGFIHNDTGMYIPHHTTITPSRTFGEVMMDLSRPNSEGWVVWVTPFKGVKIKQADYIELHRIVTGLNRKSVWRALSQGYDVYLKMLEQLPDELYAWAKDVGSDLAHQYGTIILGMDRWYLNVLEYMEDNGIASNDRKGFALTVKQIVPQVMQGYMFSLADSKDVSAKIWRSLEPEGGER